MSNLEKKEFSFWLCCFLICSMLLKFVTEIPIEVAPGRMLASSSLQKGSMNRFKFRGSRLNSSKLTMGCLMDLARNPSLMSL